MLNKLSVTALFLKRTSVKLLLITAASMVLPFSCGLPPDTPVLLKPRIVYGFYTESEYEAVFLNQPSGYNAEYPENSTSGFNIYYRIYTEKEFTDLTGGYPLDLNDIRKFESAAGGDLLAPRQSQLTTLDAGNSTDYFKLVKIDQSGTPQFTSHHLGISKEDLVDTDGDYVEVQFRVEIPSDASSYALTLQKYKVAGAIQPASDTVNLYRRVYDKVSSQMVSKSFQENVAFNYRDGTGGKIKPDEDLSLTDIEKSYSENINDFYVAYFVAVYGLDKKKIKPIFSPPAFLGVQKISTILIRE